ncbi:MAG: hypothetical protein LBS12_02490 [Prevotellaceae bacterium]|jgi:hypothetical protein|nr:hypothetical protein [Prevotellaceae bacterium]
MQRFLDIQAHYREAGLDTREVKHAQVVQRIANLPPMFTVSPVGESVEGRTIYGIRAGTGATRVLLWSQMHGDESTATRTLFDVFNFLAASDRHNRWREKTMSQLSLCFIPMLNPDGAECNRRENACGIDINRDARRCTTPEGRILHNLTGTFAPHFSFNLHDQESYYSAGASPVPATIAFLAPPADIQESIPDNRRRAMQLIVWLNRKLQAIIPHGVAKWSDAYEPRAFGEWSQAQHSATILVESGGYYNDPQREFVRKIHFGILLEALSAIASFDYAGEPLSPYFAIPQNRENGMFDSLQRQQTLTIHGTTYITDIGFRKGEQFAGDFESFGSLEADERMKADESG